MDVSKAACGKQHVFRSNSTNTTMAEKDPEARNRESNENLNNERKHKKKKFSRAMSFDIKALTAALKHTNESSPDMPKSHSPRQKKSYTDYRHPSSSSDIEEELHDQSFCVQYLGHVDLKSPGLNEIIDTVNKVYSRAKPYLKSLDKFLLSLTRSGILIQQYGDSPKDSIESTEAQASSNPTEAENLYKPRRILYCGVDKQHQRVFYFNYQFGARAENIQLHVLVCKTKDDAKNVAKYLAQLFKRISTDMHKRDKEDKKQHQERLTKFKTAKSNTSIHTYSNMTYPSINSSVGSKESNCSTGTCGSGEWVPDKERERIELSMA